MAQPLVLTWPKSPHSLRLLQEGEALIVTLIISKPGGEQMIPVALPGHIRLKDIESAWKGEWEQIFERIDPAHGRYEAVRVLRIPDRLCTIVWAVRHTHDKPADLCQARSGSATDEEIIAAYFDKPPAIAQTE